MLRLALPHVNVLTKVSYPSYHHNCHRRYVMLPLFQIDLLQYYGQLPFNLDFFTEMTDLTPLLK